MSNFISQNNNSNLKNNVKQRAYLFSIDIVKFVKDLPNSRIYWVIGDQLLRAATSIAANLIEAISSSSRRDFIKFYEIALKSANETKYWLFVLKDCQLSDSQKIEVFIKELDEISKMLGSSLLTLKGKRSVRF